MKSTMKKFSVALAAALFIAACGGSTASPSASAAALTGDISIDGSSTVYPITEAVAEEFQNANSGVQVTVAFSGTGGGFKKFCAGEMDANNASRPSASGLVCRRPRLPSRDDDDARARAALDDRRDEIFMRDAIPSWVGYVGYLAFGLLGVTVIPLLFPACK